MSFKVNLSHMPAAMPQRVTKVGVTNTFTTGSAKYIKAPQYIVAEGANTNVLLGLNADNHKEQFNALMMLASEQQSINKLKDGLTKCIETLQEKLDCVESDIRAILVGGKNSNYKNSFTLFDEIAKTLDEFGIPFSMICGKFDNVADDSMSIGRNGAQVWNKSLKDLNIPKDASQEDIENILQDNYEVVELSKEIPILIS